MAQARTPARARWFFIHLGVFVVVNAALFLYYVFGDTEGWWFFAVVLGWGLLLAIHAVLAFGWRVLGVATPRDPY
jgi:hypothetical protein